MANFDDMALAVESFGGSNKVIFDNVGLPSIMVGVPKMKYKDVITGGIDEVLPWWVVDGVEKEVIWVSKFQNVVVNDRAYSLALKDPRASINFDTALNACKNKGEGWHLNQNGVFSAINLWCQKNGTVPRGNTDYGQDFNKPWEKAIRSASETYETDKIRTTRTATGSGPATWYHNHDTAGIADLCGNVWEWVSGLRLVDGEIQIIPYGNSMKNACNMGANSTEWKAIKPDGSLVAPGTAGTLKIDRTSASDSTLRINTSITNQTTDSNDTSSAFKDVKATSGVSIPNILIAAGLFPESTATYGGDRIYGRNNGERLPLRGSGYDNRELAGASGLNLNYPRSGSDSLVGFRSAFVE
ncbi:hypothetical protein ACQPUL_08520 [Clostridium butyricum]|uniref:hypothetical protein n=1 Tax=Clostridium butyricum TaxID=1492 RepID=UPI003D351198